MYQRLRKCHACMMAAHVYMHPIVWDRTTRTFIAGMNIENPNRKPIRFTPWHTCGVSRDVVFVVFSHLCSEYEEDGFLEEKMSSRVILAES